MKSHCNTVFNNLQL